MSRPALLALADGTVLEGVAFGADVPAVGELVFNTSMTGYQEILTDPSYAGQIVTFTMPHIGNYGTNDRDLESDGIKAAGLVVRAATAEPSNWQSQRSIDGWLRECGVCAIAEIDTRSLTRKLRTSGVMAATIVPGKSLADAAGVLAELRQQPDYASVDWVARVAAREVSTVTLDADDRLVMTPAQSPMPAGGVAVLDYGVKHSILRNLLKRGIAVTLVPPTLSAEEVLAFNPTAVLISNGPGDPDRLADAPARVRALAEAVPTWGICLGHQLIARAFGARTFKLRFGHRGPNQPVLDRATGRVLITSQNHGYAVEADSIPDELEVTQHNLNDDTVAAIRHRGLNVQAVQYHPEAGPGPHDAVSFFDEFKDALAQAV